MQFSQSRANSRGALIAVIKIEIDVDRTDRIFLHQNDDDFKLAQEFVEKHALEPSLAHHIHERIDFSRRSVEAKQSKQITTPRPFKYPEAKLESRNQYKQVTPYENLISQREEPHSMESSFGHNIKKPLETVKNPSLFQTNEGDTCTKTKIAVEANEQLLEAPSKRLFDDKEFKLYHEDELESEEAPIKLFPSEHKQLYNQGHLSPPPKKASVRVYDTANDSKKSNKIQEILQQREAVSDYLRGSKSMPKFKSLQSEKVEQNFPKPHQIATVKRSYDKPTHVKILKKEEIQSLNQSLKRSISKKELSRINKDVTSRLYNEAEIKKNYLNIIKQKAKKEKEKLEDVELTYRPEINKISKVIAEGRRKNDVPVEKYLIQQGKKAEVKKQQEMNKKYLKEIENCTFEPQLNLISQKLAAEKEKFDSRMSENKARKSKYQDENLFRPSLSKVTNELMKDKADFDTRQREFLDQKNSKLVEKVKQKRINEKIDSVTGQQLFKPKINDLGIRQSQGGNIGNYLYELGKQANNHTYIFASNRPKINESSQTIVQQLHLKRISWLFSQLDSDQDGTINSQKINIASIPSQLLNVIKPILFEMQEMNEELNLLDFKNAIEMLHKQLTTYEKNILYHTKPKAK